MANASPAGPAPTTARFFFCTADRKSTRLNSSHVSISYAVFCYPPPCPCSLLFPYPTLFRSVVAQCFVKFLFAGDLFGDIKLPADLAMCIKQRYLMTTRRRIDGKRQPRRTCADHRQIFFLHGRSEEHTSELQSRFDLVCRLLLSPPLSLFSPLSLPDALPICSSAMFRKIPLCRGSVWRY